MTKNSLFFCHSTFWLDNELYNSYALAKGRRGVWEKQELHWVTIYPRDLSTLEQAEDWSLKEEDPVWLYKEGLTL